MEFRLVVPSNLSALRLVQAFVAASAELAGFDKDQHMQFNLLAEEAFLYVLRIKEEDEELEITVRSEIDGSYLTIAFLDKGLPFSYKKKHSAVEQASLALIKTYSKSFRWINHRKEGKELRILFQRPQTDITEYQLLSSNEKEQPSDDISIQLFDGRNAYQISQLIYKCYGYTYPNEDLYVPERIAQLNREGKVLSVVAVDQQYDKIIGHYGLERYGMQEIAEFGQAVVEPGYRGKRLLYRMRQELETTAKATGINGVFSQPVTSHVRSQIVNVRLNAKPCGVSFGLVPREFNFKKMEVKPLSERETCLMYYKPFVVEERNLYIPAAHQDIIDAIYENLGIGVRPADHINISQKSAFDANYNTAWGFGSIDVTQVGFDFKNSLKNVFYQLKLSTSAELVFLNLPLTECPLDEYVEAIEELGFFFCGVLPYALGGRDVIRFQYLNTMIDVERIEVYEDAAREIVDYSVSMMKRAFS